MKRTYCDICKKEFDDELTDLDFATIEDSEIRLFSDGDICGTCWTNLQQRCYSAIKTHVCNNIKIIGNWNNKTL